MSKRLSGLVDDVLIYLMLGVTIAHLTSFPATFEAQELRWVAFLQAIAIDGAIARCSYLYHRYVQQKRRRWALAGILFFSINSLVFNFGYYSDQGANLIEASTMAALFPTGVALLSYLKGQKDLGVQTEPVRSSNVLIGTGRRPARLGERHRQALNLLTDDPTLSYRELGEMLGVSKSTAGNLVNGLIRDRYVQRNGRALEVIGDRAQASSQPTLGV